jgi:polar amino acid transport system substrate-binding protein
MSCNLEQASLLLFIFAMVFAAHCVPSLAQAPATVAVPRFLAPRAGTADVSKPASIRFVTSDDFPPFNFIDGSGKLTGYNVELARAICTRLAIPCTIQVRPFPLLLDAVRSNRADAVVAGVRDTPTLRRFLGYTEAYLRLPARFVMRRADAVEAVPETLAGRTVGVVGGTRYRDFLADFFPETSVRETATVEEALAALKAGEIDAAFGGALQASFWLAGPEAADCCAFAGGAYTEPAYFGEGLSIAVAVENEPLRLALEDALRALEVDGVMADLYLRFFPAGLY